MCFGKHTWSITRLTCGNYIKMYSRKCICFHRNRPLPDEDDINTDNQDELFEEGALVMDIEEEMEDENDSWVQ